MYLLILFVLICLVNQLSAFCPAKCLCDNKKFRVVCNNANFDTLPIMLNPNLKELYLANNQIKKMSSLNDVYNNLEVLDLSGNQITSIEDNAFNRLSKLKVFKLNRNKISNLTRYSLNGLDSLEHLVISYNELTELNGQPFAQLKNLKRLDLSFNQLKNLDSDLFANQSNLIDLDLSFNKLTFSNLTIDQNPIKSEYLLSLISLNLAGNQLINLTNLNSPFTKINDHNSDDQFEQPTYLQLKANTIGQLINDNQQAAVFSQYTTYPKYILTNNLNFKPTYQTWNRRSPFINQPSIAERRVNFKKWANLRELDLSKTELSFIENNAISSLSHLQVLKLKNNNLLDIPNIISSEMTSLKLLDISQNLFEQLNKDSFIGLQQLEILNISNCQSLKYIHDKSFNGLRKLQRLDISACPQLTELNADIFQPLINLKQLYLKGNGLTSLDSTILTYANNIQILDIRNNPFYCDCNLKWLINVLYIYANQSAFNLPNYLPFAEQQQQLHLELSQVHCAGPSAFAGKLIYELTNDQLNCIDLKPFVFIFIGIFVVVLVVLTIIFAALMYARYASGKWNFTIFNLKKSFREDSTLQSRKKQVFKSGTLNSSNHTSTTQRTLHRLLGTGNLFQTDKTFNVNNTKPEFTWLPSIANNSSTLGHVLIANSTGNKKPCYVNKSNNPHLLFNNMNKTSTICSSMINNYIPSNNETTIINGLNHSYEVVKDHVHHHHMHHHHHRMPNQLNQQQPISNDLNSSFDNNASYIHHNYATLYDTMPQTSSNCSNSTEHYSSSLSTTTTLSSSIANQSNNSTNLPNVNSSNIRCTSSTNQSTNPMRYQHPYLQTWNPSFDEKMTPMINSTTPISAI